MLRAIELAWRGLGRVEPNPMVGALVVRDGLVVGEGWHDRFGGPHAEVVALAAAADLARGADLFVTLEPCSTSGKTPPCTEAIMRAGPARVFIATRDPSVRNGGHGIAALRDAGLAVDVGRAELQAKPLLESFVRYLGSDRPHVVAKWAMTLDGKIATSRGDARWISGEESRRRVHQERSRADGIMVGIGTVLADDPRLTCRIEGGRDPVRIVVDPALALPLEAELVRSVERAPTVVLHREVEAPPRTGKPEQAAGRPRSDGMDDLSPRARSLRALGVTVEAIGGDDSEFMRGVLCRLREMGIERLLVEGGEGLFTRLLDAGAIDQVHAFVAPKLAGGREAKTPLGGAGVARMDQALPLRDVVVERLGPDVLVRGFIGAVGVKKAPSGSEEASR